MEKRSALLVLMIAACSFSYPARAQVEPKLSVLSASEQIKAERAKAAREEAAQPTTRPWDRDANGKRPWDIKTDAK